MRLDCGQQDKNHFRSVTSTLPMPYFSHFFPEKTITVAKPYPHLFPNNPPYFHPFTSTGKERDEETGYSYFGARYYDPEISGLFLSVDPLADKYAGISPYSYCAWNPVKLVDPDGEDPIYGIIWFNLRKIGDDGKNDRKSYLVTGTKKISVLFSTIRGRTYQGSLSPDKNVFHVPTGKIAEDVDRTIDLVKQSGDRTESRVEYGAHALFGDVQARIWDPGSEMETDENDDGTLIQRWSIKPFRINGKDNQYLGDPQNIEFIWHIHPDDSKPSNADENFAFDKKYNYRINATWFTIGINDNKVTFYDGSGKSCKVDYSDFQRMSKQE